MKGIHPFIVKGKKCGTVSEFVKPEHNQPSLDHISWNSRHASGQEKYRKNKWGHGPPHPPPFPTPNLCAAQTTSMQTPETQIPPTLVKHKIFKWRWNSHHPDSTSYLSKKKHLKWLRNGDVASSDSAWLPWHSVCVNSISGPSSGWMNSIQRVFDLLKCRMIWLQKNLCSTSTKLPSRHLSWTLKISKTQRCISKCC